MVVACCERREHRSPRRPLFAKSRTSTDARLGARERQDPRRVCCAAAVTSPKCGSISTNPRLSINPMFIPRWQRLHGPSRLLSVLRTGIGRGTRAGSARPRRSRDRSSGSRRGLRKSTAEGFTFFYGADLPKTQYKIERAVTLKAGETTVHVEEWIENLAPYDWPYNRNQHATFGAPFVTPGRNVLDMSGTRGITDPKRTAGGKWARRTAVPVACAPRSDGIDLSLRDFHAIPGGQVYTPVLTDRSKTRAGSRFTTPTTRCSSAMCFQPTIIRGLLTGRTSLAATWRRNRARHRIRDVSVRRRAP